MNVVVIGGGPAGSLAAVLLTRAGVAVTLIEQHRFPRDKVCGECLSALGLDVLRRHDLSGGMEAIGRPIGRAALFGHGQHATLDLPRPMLGVSRAAMDTHLLRAAADAGATVLQPARAEAVVPCDGFVTVRVRQSANNAVAALRADYAVVADGRGALMPERPSATDDLGIKAHFVDVAADAGAVTLYGGLDAYGGVAPIEGDRWNAAFAVPRRTIAGARGDVDAVWRQWIGRSAAMRRHFAAATRVGEWLASPLPRHAPAADWPPRVVPVGAAAGAIEPVGGEGMGTALRSAELAVDALVRGRLAGLPSAYTALWRRRGFFCRLGGRLMAHADHCDLVALAGHDAVRRAAMWCVGK